MKHITHKTKQNEKDKIKRRIGRNEKEQTKTTMGGEQKRIRTQ